MTDFAPESLGSGDSTLTPQTFWVSASRPAPPARPSRGVTVLPAQSSAASLAAATQHLLESMVSKRVPRLDKLRRQLEQAGVDGGVDALAEVLDQLHEGLLALDFLGSRSGGEKAAEFARQAAALVDTSTRLASLASGFAERHANDGPVVRLLWIELVIESRSLHKRVRQGAHWLAQLDRDLRSRRAAASTEVTQQALAELTRRAQALHQRLQTVHRLCGHVRSVHTACEQTATQRGELCVTLQERVLPARERLQAALQPLVVAAIYRPLVPEELMAAVEAQHALQVELTQAAAEMERLRASAAEAAAQLAGIQEKVQALA